MLYSKKKFGKNRKEIFWVVMGSSLFTIIFSSIVILLFFNSIKSIEIENYEKKSKVNVLSIENELRNVMTYTYSILLNSNNIIVGDENREDINVSSYYPLSIKIKDYKDVNRIINSIALYYPKQDLVICDEGAFRIKEYFLLNTPYSERDNYGNWYQYMSNLNTGFDIVDNQLIYNVLIKKNNKTIGLIQYKIDAETLFEISGNINLTNDVLNALIIDDKILYQDNTTDSIFEDTITLKELKETHSFSDESMYIGYYELSDFGIQVISVVDLSKYTNQVRIYLLIMFLLFVGIILFSILYSLEESARINNPIKAIADKVNLNEDDEKIDNYKIINQRIDEFISNTNFQSNKIHEMENRIYSLFLYSLLHEGVIKNDVYFEMDLLNINLTYSSFYLAIIDGNELSLGEFKNRCNELIDDSLDIFTYMSNSYLLLFINTDNNEPDGAIVSYFEELIDGEEFNKLRILVSGQCDDLENLFICYKQVLGLYKSNMFRGNFKENNSVTFELKKAIEANDNDLYFLTVDSIFGDNLNLSSSLVDDAVNLINKEFGDETLVADDDGYYWKADFINVLKQKTKNSEILVEKANQIIQNEFTNKDLGLYNIAERLEVSNSYLSTLYKNHYGIGLIQTLNHKRVELAKVLLLNSKKSIKDVALEVGFSSDISFIRVFKKIESQTPGNLRKMNTKNK